VNKPEPERTAARAMNKTVSYSELSTRKPGEAEWILELQELLKYAQGQPGGF
jgi:hypothetical protein